jgi:hypothetical protein
MKRAIARDAALVFPSPFLRGGVRGGAVVNSRAVIEEPHPLPLPVRTGRGELWRLGTADANRREGYAR